MTADAKFKPVPPAPDDLTRLDDARRGVPLVPSEDSDCCARIARRLELQDRDAGQTWFTFLRALRLVERSKRGYTRRREDLDTDALGERFRGRVVGADEVVTAVEAAEKACDVAAVFERVAETVPTWERNRHGDWEAVWRDRTARLLDWAVLFDLIDRTGGGYRSERD